MYTLQKEEFRICQARSIELQICRILNKAQQPAKRLRFQSNTTKYKRKTLKHIFQVLRVTLVRSVRFCTFQLYQAPTGDQIHIASTGGVKLQPSLQLSSVLKIKA